MRPTVSREGSYWLLPCVFRALVPAVSRDGAIVTLGAEGGVSLQAEPTRILCRVAKQVLVKPITVFNEYLVIRSLVLYEVTACSQWYGSDEPS